MYRYPVTILACTTAGPDFLLDERPAFTEVIARASSRWHPKRAQCRKAWPIIGRPAYRSLGSMLGPPARCHHQAYITLARAELRQWGFVYPTNNNI